MTLYSLFHFCPKICLHKTLFEQTHKKSKKSSTVSVHRGAHDILFFQWHLNIIERPGWPDHHCVQFPFLSTMTNDKSHSQKEVIATCLHILQQNNKWFWPAGLLVSCWLGFRSFFGFCHMLSLGLKEASNHWNICSLSKLTMVLCKN